jgi:hypothetical protein
MKNIIIDDLSDSQKKALLLASEHGSVCVSKGFGRSAGAPSAIASVTFVKLVSKRVLTPNKDGSPFAGPALRVETGDTGYLTDAGKQLVVQLKSQSSS